MSEEEFKVRGAEFTLEAETKEEEDFLLELERITGDRVPLIQSGNGEVDRKRRLSFHTASIDFVLTPLHQMK